MKLKAKKICLKKSAIIHVPNFDVCVFPALDNPTDRLRCPQNARGFDVFPLFLDVSSRSGLHLATECFLLSTPSCAIDVAQNMLCVSELR